MERALVISSGGKGQEALGALLSGCGFDAITYAESAPEAKRLAGEESYALALINAPIDGDKADALAIELAIATQAGIVLLYRPEDMADEAIIERAIANGILALTKPVARQLMEQAVRHARAMHARLGGARKETERLQLKLDEVRMVNRAKAMLIKHLSMSEDAAHRYIEKQAMDLRLSRMDVAKNILKNYSI